MNTSTPISNVKDPMRSRTAKESSQEIVVIGMFSSILVFVLMGISGGDEWIAHAISAAPTLGAQVLPHIGWGFNVYIPVMLGFYAIVFGGQLIARDEQKTARTRRMLAFIAELMAGGQVPSLLLIAALSIQDPSQVGVLLIVIPAAAVMFFLAIELGRFQIPDRDVQLASSIRTRDWAQARLPLLQLRSNRSVGLVLFVNILVGSSIGVVAALVLGMPAEVWLAQIGLSAVIAFLLLAVNLYGVEAFHSARDSMSKYLAWMPSVVLYLFVLVVASELFLIVGKANGIALLFMSIFCALSAVWPRKLSPQFFLNWSVQGAGISRAKTLVSASLEESKLKIDECRTASAPDKRDPLRKRFLKALAILLEEESKNLES